MPESNDHKNGYFTNKKTAIQFVLSLFVFYTHFRVFSTFKDTGKPLSTLLDALMAITEVAVPLFFAISGALFYRNYTLSKTLQKWKSRFFSLCVPYLIWNTIWLILALLGYYTPLGAYLGGVATPLTLESVFAGIFLHRFFEPFWFILRLIILTAFCPVIYLLLRNKYVGLTLIGAWIVLLLFGIDILEGLNIVPEKMIMYFIGAWVGIHHFEWVTCRRSKKTALICFMVYIICSFFLGTSHILPQWIPVTQIKRIVIIISCFAFYISFDLLSMESCPDYMKESFLIYAMHSLVGAIISKILRMLLPEGNIFTVLTAVVAFTATVAFICMFGKYLGRYAPRLKRVLAGR